MELMPVLFDLPFLIFQLNVSVSLDRHVIHEELDKTDPTSINRSLPGGKYLDLINLNFGILRFV